MSHTKTTWKNIRRSPYQALAAIFIMTLTFLIVSFFTFVLYGSHRIINFLESKPQVTAFFKNEAKPTDINVLQEQIRANQKVASVKFVSKEKALQIYKEQNKSDPLLLDLVTADVLPASLEISTVRIEDLQGISDTLKGSPIVQEVIYQKDVISTLTSWTNAIRGVGIGLIVILSLVSVFTMITIIGIKISQKKQDMEIMKLIGATNWHIRWPFILEGVYYGAIGSFIGWGISSILLWSSMPVLTEFFKGITVFPNNPLLIFILLGLELVAAVILGALSSYMAVLRYLK
jgi:cell division transport system permease protein